MVIGGGAAGLGAARAAVRVGARTLLVCDGEPGGDCTLTGWVPSKTLIQAARHVGGGWILGAAIVATGPVNWFHKPVLAMATGMVTGRLAAAHAYPTWSYRLQLAAAPLVMTVGGRTARPTRKMP